MTGRHELRDRILRIVRSAPALRTAQIAAIAGCHPSTVSDHLRAVRRGRAAAVAVTVRCREHPADEKRTEIGTTIRGRRCPGRLLATLAADPSPPVRAAAVADSGCPPSLAARLVRDRSPAVRAAAAAQPNTGRSQLARLAGGEIHFRFPAAGNRSTPPAALAALAADTEPTVRARAAANPNIPACVLVRLATTGDHDTRLAVAGNPNTPPAALAALAADNTAIRSRALAHSGCRASTFKKVAEIDPRYDRDGWAAAAKNPNCPEGMLRQAADIDDAETRRRTAGNPNCPSDLLDRLVSHPDRDTRRAVAANRSSGADLLDRLAYDNEPIVRLATAGNPNTTASTLARLAADSDYLMLLQIVTNPNCGPGTIDRAAGRDHAAPGATVAALRRTRDGDILNQNASHRDPRARAAVAANIHTPAATVGHLAADVDPIVAHTAVARFSRGDVAAAEPRDEGADIP